MKEKRFLKAWPFVTDVRLAFLLHGHKPVYDLIHSNRVMTVEFK